MSDLKILVVTFSDDQKIQFGNYDVSSVTGDSIIKYTNFEEFQNGKRLDKFDYVLIYLPEE